MSDGANVTSLVRTSMLATIASGLRGFRHSRVALERVGSPTGLRHEPHRKERHAEIDCERPGRALKAAGLCGMCDHQADRIEQQHQRGGREVVKLSGTI